MFYKSASTLTVCSHLIAEANMEYACLTVVQVAACSHLQMFHMALVCTNAEWL